MKLYHGTSWNAISKISKTGIKPRLRNKGNWKHSVSSNPKMVYLTNAYAMHFAFNASKGHLAGAILEIDTDLLDENKLYPDEDAVEQSRRTCDELPPEWDIKQRNAYYISNIELFHSRWPESLEILGNCSHLGIIPPRAITKVAKVSFDAMATAIVLGFDPVISVLNYHFLGHRYRQFSNWIFDPSVDLDVSFNDVLYDRLRSGITLMDLPK